MADRLLDKTFSCTYNDNAGVITATVEIQGRPKDTIIHEATITINTLLLGYAPEGVLIINEGAIPGTIGETFEATITTKLYGEAVFEELKTNWVGWSKIGDVTFVQDDSNESGYRPLPWPGWAYRVLQLDKNAVVYGNNGVALFYPVTQPAPTFGMRELLEIGIKGKNAVCGDRKRHYCIDTKGCLWEISEQGVRMLGYEEFLEPLVNPVMFFDSENDKVFINDATTGYVLTTSGLGGGIPNLSGIIWVNGVPIVGSPAVLTEPEPLTFCTDILDFGTREQKTIEFLQVGVDGTTPMKVAVDYRYNKSEAFRTTAYKLLNKEGVAFIRAAGVEFRLRFKMDEYEYVEVDYVKVHYKKTDRRYGRSYWEKNSYDA